MSAIGFIIFIAILKVLLSLSSSRSSSSQPAHLGDQEDRDAFDGLASDDDYYDRDVLPLGNIAAAPYIDSGIPVAMSDELSDLGSSDDSFADTDCSSWDDRP